MIIPLDKLLMVKDNKYFFTKAAMKAVDRIGNMKQYPEDEQSWKVVPNVLQLILDGDIHYEVKEDEEEPAPEEES